MRGSSLKLVEKVAAHLGPDLRQEVAFLGGATIELLLTDPAADEVRPTNDVDVITAGHSHVSFLVHFADRLRARGFREGGDGPHRWQVDGIIVDVMPIEADILGFSNRWYAEALAKAQGYRLPSGLEIRLVTAPYVIATKMEAYLGRGNGDLLMSHDIGDIIALVDGRPELFDDLQAASQTLQLYICDQMSAWLANSTFTQLALPAHLPFEGGRTDIVVERLRNIVEHTNVSKG